MSWNMMYLHYYIGKLYNVPTGAQQNQTYSLWVPIKLRVLTKIPTFISKAFYHAFFE